MRSIAVTVVGGVLALGCGSKSLQDLDAGGSVDATVDLPTDVPLFTGIRSFVVTSQLQRDGGVGTFSSSHGFTLVLDGDRRTAIAGGGGEGNATTFEPAAGGALHFVGTLRFGIAGPGCAGSSITYDDLRVTIDASGRLTGTGRGQVLVFSDDLGSTAAATMSLIGVADTQPPTLTASGDAVDPFASFSVVSTEPLPPSAGAVLRGAGGETDALIPTGTMGSFVSAFQKPAKMLRYATQYQITIEGVTDFAGNAAIGDGLIFTTRPAPPLAPEDGFESATAAMFGGVQVLSEAGAPTITGTKSLYIPPPIFGSRAQPTLTLRLQLTTGDTVVRFAYRTVVSGASATIPDFSYGIWWMLGSDSGKIGAPSLPIEAGAATTVMIDGAQVTLGPITTATLPLPAGAAGEIVLQRTAQLSGSCGPPPPPLTGIIIDDLRAE